MGNVKSKIEQKYECIYRALLEDGAFISADLSRTDPATGKIVSNEITKIYPLTEKLVIATGGLGTIGHQARIRVQQKILPNEIDSNTIIEIIKDEFSLAYKNSLKTFGNHNVPLYAIIAGQNEKGVRLQHGLSHFPFRMDPNPVQDPKNGIGGTKGSRDLPGQHLSFRYLPPMTSP